MLFLEWRGQQLKMILKKRTENWQFSGILIRIPITKKQQKRFSKKLVKHIQFFQTKRREPYLIAMEKKA
jgi:hypothetical protein